MNVLFLIESTFLLLLALGLRQRSTEPAHRAAIAFAAMAALPLLALAQLADIGWHPLTQHVSLDTTAPVAGAPMAAPVTAPAWSLWSWLWLAYGVVTAWRLLRWAHAQSRVRGWLRDTRPCAAPAWQRQSRLLADALGCRAVPVLVHAAAGSPFLVGLRRPRVVIPAYLEQCSEARARLVLLHEGAHWQARDPLRLLLVDLICCVLWFQPLLQRVRRGFRDDMELACDDRVLRAGSDAHDYAETIALCAAQQHAQGAAALVGMAMQRSQLVQRVTRILEAPQAAAYARWRWPSLALGGAWLLLLGVNWAPRVVVDAAALSLADATVEFVAPALVSAPRAIDDQPAPVPATAATPREPVTRNAAAVDAMPRVARREVAPAPAATSAAVTAPAVTAPAVTAPAPVIDSAQLQRSISQVVDLDAQRYAQQYAGEPLPESTVAPERARMQARFERGIEQSRQERDARRDRVIRQVVLPVLGAIPL